MKKNAHSRPIAFTLLVAVVLLMLSGTGIFIFEIAAGGFTDTAIAKSLEARDAERTIANPVTCPSPTVDIGGGSCGLQGDTPLTTALALPSNTKLDCQGHKLFATGDKEEKVGSQAVTHSQPEVGIFLKGTQNVLIQRCVMEGFDFGIFAINSKVSAADRTDTTRLAALRNRITLNKITARYSAISLMSVDNTEISDNNDTNNGGLIFTTIGGRGIVVARNSDLNIIRNNTITAQFSGGAQGAYRAPGQWRWSSLQLKPPTNAGAAVFISQPDGPTLLNTIIEGTLYQLAVSNSAVPNRDFTEDSLIEGNIIKCIEGSGGTNCVGGNDGIALALAQRTTMRGNTISNTRAAIRAGIQTGLTGLPRQFPGRCTSDAGRLCLTDVDCNIVPSFDQTSKGTCALPPLQTTYWLSGDSVIENNTILGPFTLAIVLAGNGTIVQGNTIDGMVNGQKAGDGMFLMGSFPLETTTMTRNTVSNVVNALTLQKVFNQTPGITELVPSAFGARISLNDFTGYATAVQTGYVLPTPTPTSSPTPPPVKFYDLPSELSVNGQGNYWGLTCAAGGFDQNKVLQAENNSTNFFVMDSHPYGGPVARAKLPPEICSPAQIADLRHTEMRTTDQQTARASLDVPMLSQPGNRPRKRLYRRGKGG